MDLFRIFLKRLIYKIPLKLLFIILLTLLILMVCIAPSFCAYTGTESDYGFYLWYQSTSNLIDNFNNFISNYKENYDSFIICSKTHTYCLFYNFEETGYCRTQRDGFSSNYNFIFENGNPTDFKYYQIDLSTPEELSSIQNFIQDMSAYKVYTNRTLYTGNFNTVWMQSTDESISGSAFNFVVYLSDTSQVNEPIYCYTDWLNISDKDNLDCFISNNGTYWVSMHYQTLTDNGNTYFRFRYPIVSNGTYFFKFVNHLTDSELYYSLQVTNILSNVTNSGFNEYGIPQPFLSFKTVNNDFLIYTQYFNYSGINRYQCYFTNDVYNDNFSTWSLAPIGNTYNSIFDENYYYFFTTIPTDSQNLTLYFVFYDTVLNQFGYPSSITCDINGMTIYNNFINDIITNDSSGADNFLRTLVTNDPMEVEYLFNMLKDAFTTNEVVNCTITIPFVNKTFVISSAQVSNFYPTALVEVCHLFVWGMVGLFVIKDIRSMANKINTGEIENVSSDVKKEVL